MYNMALLKNKVLYRPTQIFQIQRDHGNKNGKKGKRKKYWQRFDFFESHMSVFLHCKEGHKKKARFCS